MENKVGLWIDHRKAVVVRIAGELEEINLVKSDMEKHVRFSGEAEKGMEEDQRDRRFTNHLNKYYDEVISLIGSPKSIFIFGPGEVKVEFKKRLESRTHIEIGIDLETTDKMTDGQIKAKVKDHFSSHKL